MVILLAVLALAAPQPAKSTKLLLHREHRHAEVSAISTFGSKVLPAVILNQEAHGPFVNLHREVQLAAARKDVVRSCWRVQRRKFSCPERTLPAYFRCEASRLLAPEGNRKRDQLQGSLS